MTCEILSRNLSQGRRRPHSIPIFRRNDVMQFSERDVITWTQTSFSSFYSGISFCTLWYSQEYKHTSKTKRKIDKRFQVSVSVFHVYSYITRSYSWTVVDVNGVGDKLALPLSSTELSKKCSYDAFLTTNCSKPLHKPCTNCSSCNTK